LQRVGGGKVGIIYPMNLFEFIFESADMLDRKIENQSVEIHQLINGLDVLFK
jgi:hypothetical protein